MRPIGLEEQTGLKSKELLTCSCRTSDTPLKSHRGCQVHGFYTMFSKEIVECKVVKKKKISSSQKIWDVFQKMFLCSFWDLVLDILFVCLFVCFITYVKIFRKNGNFSKHYYTVLIFKKWNKMIINRKNKNILFAWFYRGQESSFKQKYIYIVLMLKLVSVVMYLVYCNRMILHKQIWIYSNIYYI